MNKVIDYQALLQSLDILQHLYDIIRIVDPLTKKVIESHNSCGIEEGSRCFDLWQRNLVCENCVAARACQTRETIMKIEYNGEKLFSVTAAPIETSEGLKVLELMKDITETGIIEDMSAKDTITLYNLVGKTNEQILKDPLTNLHNRRFIDGHLGSNLMQARLKQEPLALIMADIDHFKNINDQYGHLAGDYVLKAVAHELQRHRTNQDWTARYGSEEFLICLKNTPAQQAVQIAERFRKNIEALTICYDDQNITCTVSFGICAHTEHTMTAEQMINCADQKLYEAKKTGRNKVVI